MSMAASSAQLGERAAAKAAVVELVADEEEKLVGKYVDEWDSGGNIVDAVVPSTDNGVGPSSHCVAGRRREWDRISGWAGLPVQLWCCG